MEASSKLNTVDLNALRIDVLRRAAASYLKFAYPSGDWPETVKRRLDWTESEPPQELLTKPPFEKAGKVPGTQTPIFALRLGNARYPHMKLQIQPWPNDAGLMLSVNTHDQIAGLDLALADAQGFKELQTHNQALKEAIEQAWENEGLPTFLKYLRDYIEHRAEESPPANGDSPQAES